MGKISRDLRTKCLVSLNYTNVAFSPRLEDCFSEPQNHFPRSKTASDDHSNPT